MAFLEFYTSSPWIWLGLTIGAATVAVTGGGAAILLVLAFFDAMRRR